MRSIILSMVLSMGAKELPELPEFPLPPIPALTWREAIKDKSNLPLVAFIGCEQRDIPGALIAHEDSLKGWPAKCIVVSVRNGSYRDAYAISHEATDADIKNSIASAEKLKKPWSNDPFHNDYRRRGEAKFLNDIESARSRWPSSAVPFPFEAVRYRPARYTQSIFKFVGSEQGIIRPVHRSELKMESQIPGGMEGIDGWTSDLYKYVPGMEASTVSKLVPVKNSFGHYQNEWAYVRDYPDGTWFADLLSYHGKPFELRIREKNEGKWESYVAYKDKEARPPNYAGLSKKCAECHNQAGSGDYGVGLWSGSDTVISDPFAELEK